MVLSNRVYHHICKQGEKDELLAALKDKDIFKLSKFGSSEGYRFELENAQPYPRLLVGQSNLIENSSRSNINRKESDHSRLEDADSSQNKGLKLNDLERDAVTAFVEEISQNEFERNNWWQFAECFIQLVRARPNPLITKEELIRAGEAVKTHAVFQKAIRYTLPLTPIEDPSVYADHLHFSSTSAFAYHTLKHGGAKGHVASDIFSSDSSGQHYIFDIHRFADLAKSYLKEARETIKNANCKSELPDQRKDEITDYAYYQWKENIVEMKEIIGLQQQIEYHQNKIKKLKTEQENRKYQLSALKRPDPIHSDIEDTKKTLMNRKDNLRRLQQKIFSKLSTNLVAVRVEAKEQSTAMFLKTFTPSSLNLDKLREGKLKEQSHK